MSRLSGHSVARLFAEAAFRLRSGPRSVFFWLSDRLRDRRNDRRFGIHSLDPLTKPSPLPSPDLVAYQPVSYSDMQEILGQLAVSSADVFLDYGAGMGRALCLAAEHPFQQVIGIEISAELSACARANIRAAGRRLACQNVTVVTGDARTYEIPSAVSIIFFFNPFRAAAMEDVLRNIEASLEQTPRSLRVLFYGTRSSREFREQVRRHTRLRLARETYLKTGAVCLTCVSG